MIRTLTVKQKVFGLAFLETGNASEAYRRAYDTQNMKPESIRVNACKLKKHANIVLMLEQLQVRQTQQYNVTIDSLTTELETLRQLALKNNQPHVGIKAVMALAKLHGYIKGQQYGRQ